jgi:putative endonuclease
LLASPAMPATHNVTLGKTGERLACAELRRRGYAILANRYRTRSGELDIVAREGRTIVFVEVKARSSDRYGMPGEAITWHKRRRLCLMAQDYLARHRLGHVPCRFDVVTVMTDGARRRVEVIRNAFDADG